MSQTNEHSTIRTTNSISDSSYHSSQHSEVSKDRRARPAAIRPLASTKVGSVRRGKSGKPAGRRRQGIFWILTIPAGESDTRPPCLTTLSPPVVYIKGQLECGGKTGYRHWQVIAAVRPKQSIHGIKSVFGRRIHADLTHRKSSLEYVWKVKTKSLLTLLGRNSCSWYSVRDWQLSHTCCSKGRLGIR